MVIIYSMYLDLSIIYQVKMCFFFRKEICRQFADYVNTISNVKAEFINWISSITVTVTITKSASGKQLYVLGSRGDIICIELTASKINFVTTVNNAYLTVTKTSDTTFTITGSAGAVTILTLGSNISYTYEITTNE